MAAIPISLFAATIELSVPEANDVKEKEHVANPTAMAAAAFVFIYTPSKVD